MCNNLFRRSLRVLLCFLHLCCPRHSGLEALFVVLVPLISLFYLLFLSCLLVELLYPLNSVLLSVLVSLIINHCHSSHFLCIGLFSSYTTFAQRLKFKYYLTIYMFSLGARSISSPPSTLLSFVICILLMMSLH